MRVVSFKFLNFSCSFLHTLFIDKRTGSIFLIIVHVSLNTVHRTEYHLLWWAVIQFWRSMAKECEPEYTHGVWLKVLFNLTNRPIYEFQKPSLSKWGQGHNLSCESEFICMWMKNHFHIKGCAPNLICFDTEAWWTRKSSIVSNFPYQMYSFYYHKLTYLTQLIEPFFYVKNF